MEKQTASTAREASAQTLEDRATQLAARVARVGIPKSELAVRAGVDRGTLGRALKADPRVTDRTWTRLGLVLSQLEEEFGIAVELPGGDQIETTVEYQGAKITLSGKADAVAEAIRRVLDGD